MSNEITKSSINGNTMETVLIKGDLATLSPDQRIAYYKAVCDSVGLNPLTKPFDYITLNNRLVLYAKRDATDQLRAIHGVSITNLTSETINGVYVVKASATDKTGRTDTSTGAVNIEGLKGDALANALMKAETKAKRRVTLSLCGLGLLDETEVESIQDAKVTIVKDDGAIISNPDPISAKTWARWLEVKAEAEAAGIAVPDVNQDKMTESDLREAGKRLRIEIDAARD